MHLCKAAIAFDVQCDGVACNCSHSERVPLPPADGWNVDEEVAQRAHIRCLYGTPIVGQKTVEEYLPP